MNYKTTLFLLVLLVLVAGFFFWARRHAPAPPPPDTTTRTPEGTPLFAQPPLDPQSIHTIVLQKSDRQARLQRQGQDWWLTEPVRFPLNSWSASDLVQDSASLRYLEKFRPGTAGNPSLAELSLDPPRARMELLGTGPAEKPIRHLLLLGRKTIGDRAYLMLDDDPHVYVVPARLHTLILDNDWTTWRKRSIDAPTLPSLRRLLLQHADVTLELIRSDDQWAFAPPHAGRADDQALSSLLSNLSNLYISRFVADKPADLSLFGLDQPTLTLQLEPASPSTGTTDKPDSSTSDTAALSTLRIGAPTDLKAQQFFACWTSPQIPDPVVFEISKYDADRFRKTVNDLRDPRLSLTRSSDLRELEILPADAAPWKLSWTPQGWSFADPAPPFSADKDQALTFVQSIADLRAQSYQPDFQPASDPLLTLKLLALGKSEPEILRFYPDPADSQSLLALRNNETVAYRLARDKLQAFFLPPLALRQRLLWDVKPDDLQSIHLIQTDGTDLLFQRDPAHPDQPWHLQGHDRFDTTAFDNLLKLLTPLSAESWHDATAPSTEPLIHLQLQRTDGSQLALQIDPATRNAVSPAVDHPFRIPADLLRALTAEFRDSLLLPFSQSDIAQVTLQRDSSRLTIRRDDLGRYVSDPAAELNQSAAASLFSTLAGLRAERLLSPADALSSPHLSLLIETTTGQKATLTLSPAPDQPATLSGDFGQKTFRLPKDTFEKLTADLIQKSPEPLK